MNLSLYTWDIYDVYFVYSPELDLVSTGKNLKEAKDSFKSILSSFIENLLEKDILFPELERLGWLTNQRKQKATPPNHEELLKERDLFSSLFNQHEMDKAYMTVFLPLN